MAGWKEHLDHVSVELFCVKTTTCLDKISNSGLILFYYFNPGYAGNTKKILKHHLIFHFPCVLLYHTSSWQGKTTGLEQIAPSVAIVKLCCLKKKSGAMLFKTKRYLVFANNMLCYAPRFFFHVPLYVTFWVCPPSAN